MLASTIVDAQETVYSLPAEHWEDLAVLAVSGNQVAEVRGGVDSQPVGCLSHCLWVQCLDVALDMGSACLSQNLGTACKQMASCVILYCETKVLSFM